MLRLTDRDADRFWPKIARGRGCWLWTAGTTQGGYGAFGLRRRGCLAHRVMYQEAYGVNPAGWHVCHKCDTPACVRPSHLFLGTNRANILDAMRKGRLATGEAHGMTSLSAEQVVIIKAAAIGGAPAKVIARVFGVSPKTVSNIATGETWGDVRLNPREVDA